MDNDSYKLAVHKGYRIQKETNLVDSRTACENILGTEEQFKFTCFELLEKGDMFKFTKHFVVCNICGQHTPAYPRFINARRVRKRFSEKTAYSWLDNARSFFETANKSVSLYRPITETGHFKCLFCGSEQRYSDKEVLLTIRFYRNKLTITYPLSDIGDIMDVNWIKQPIKIGNFPINESVTFNFKRGTTYIELKTESEKIMAITDISSGVNDLSIFTSPLINLISDNATVKGAVYKHFEEFWDKKLPFKAEELDIHKFALLNAFVGYSDKTFYSYIPCNNRSLTFDKSYKSMRKKMRYANNLIDLYNKSSLPYMKSIRKIIFENPKFFFFLKELEKLWAASQKEPNFFCEVLNNRYAYSTLSFLHDHPLAFELYEDVCKEKLHISFKQALLQSPQHVNEYAIIYATLSNTKKAAAKKQLKSTSCRFLKYENVPCQHFFPIPDSEATASIKEQDINGFTFTPLKTVNDFIIAGKQLNNCLGTEEFGMPIVGIKRGSKYLAAIQVDSENRFVFQAYLKSNHPLKENPFVFAAFKEWCKNNFYDFDELDLYGF